MFSQLNVPHLQTEEAAYAYVEKRLWPNGPVCPHCGATEEHVGKLQGKSSRVGLYKCYACRDPFTVKIKTIFEDSHLPLHLWLQAIYLICSSKKGISTRQIQRTLGVGLKTAWHLMHRIRHAMESGKLDPLGGIGVVIEADETYVGGKEKNKHVGKRNAGNIGGTGKVTVFSLVERGGRVRSHVVPDVTGDTLREVLKVHANKRSALMTLTFNSLLMFEEKGAASKKDVDDVLVSALLMLENPEMVTERASHAARIILGGFAQKRGIAMRKPS